MRPSAESKDHSVPLELPLDTTPALSEVMLFDKNPFADSEFLTSDTCCAVHPAIASNECLLIFLLKCKSCSTLHIFEAAVADDPVAVLGGLSFVLDIGIVDG